MILIHVKNVLIAWINLKILCICGGRPKLILAEIVRDFMSIKKVTESMTFV